MKAIKVDLCHGAVRMFSAAPKPGEGFEPIILFEINPKVGSQRAEVKDTPEMRRNIARQLRMLARKFEASVR